MRAAVLLLAVLGVAGCGGSTPALPSCAGASGACATARPTYERGASPDPIGLGVDNGTDLQIYIVVNGVVIETLAPDAADKAIRTSALPPLPWTVEVQTESGRVLATMQVSEGDLQPEPGVAAHGSESAAELSCGALYMWSGPSEPSWPAPGTGTPGDCLP